MLFRSAANARAGRLRDPKAFVGYVRIITRNKIIDRLKEMRPVDVETVADYDVIDEDAEELEEEEDAAPPEALIDTKKLEAEIAELARRDNVYCKLSGMATEADWKGWTESDLRPYFDTVLAAFGPDRLMFGSDWPVILVACSYKCWADTVRSWIAELSPAEQLSIMGGTAKMAYSL